MLPCSLDHPLICDSEKTSGTLSKYGWADAALNLILCMFASHVSIASQMVFSRNLSKTPHLGLYVIGNGHLLRFVASF